MALRIMVYLGLLYQDLIKRGDVLADGRLPPVLPIVLYNGDKRWTAATDIFDLIPPVPGLAEQFKPRLKYLLIDENAYTDSELAPLKNLVAAIFRIEHPATPEAVLELIALLADWLADRPDLGRMIAIWIRATLMRKKDYRIVLPELDDLLEVKVMLSERLKEWAHGYKAEGMQQGVQQGVQQGMRLGVQQGEGVLLQRLLTRRFGSLPSTIEFRLTQASIEQLEVWGDRIFDAESLDDVFREH
jgi:Putative transposase, YhgA-like/Domain of unknown function (DUF4351)